MSNKLVTQDDSPRAAVQALLTDYIQDRAAWIEKHGSDRLRLAKKLGLLQASDNVYREERRNKEKEGWLLPNELPPNFKALAIHNPSLVALQELEKALETDPEVTLVHLEWTEEISDPSMWKSQTRRIKRHREALSSKFIGLPVYRWTGPAGVSFSAVKGC